MKIADSPLRRMSLLIGSVAVIGVLAALFYTSSGSSTSPGLTVTSALRIVKAAHDYTYSLRQAGKPVPASIPLTNLVALKYLKPDDVSAFAGLDARLTLLVTNNSPNPVLLRVRLPDGSETVLFQNGASGQVPAGGAEPQ